VRNWAGNYTYGAARLHTPDSIEQLRELVAGADRIKALGSRHSFNGIADTPGDLVSLERLDRVIGLDRDRATVAVEGGIRYGPLCRYLAREGFALGNLASLPHISVAGACATGTHGSGVRNGNLATAVAALEIVTASGEIVALSRERDGDEFRGAVVGLGAVGIVTRLSLDVVPAFDMRQVVYEGLGWDRLERHFDEIVSSAYSVSLFTRWRDTGIEQVWVKSLASEAESDPPAEFFGASLARSPRHPIAAASPENCTEQMGICGPWHERLPHFRMEFTPSSGAELQTEYFVERRHALVALRAIGGLREHVAPLLFVTEVRTIAADDLWMSPCFGRETIAIHFTWKDDLEAVTKVLPLIEAALAPLDARPHWGKVFTMPPERVAALYPKAPDFLRLLRRRDPAGKFRNAFLERYLQMGSG
jgi:xylitol oxidase